MLYDFKTITVDSATVFHGSNLDVLPFMADNSVDSIVTDPPYELGFMGKSWDNSGIAYSVELWIECMRVLKPGGHLLAFGGSRTWHRLAVAIEDAGFEMRDSIAWLYSSGFPKSLDVSKAIDKGTGENKKRQLKFVEWMRSTGITAKQINDFTGTQMANHYIGVSQPAIATADLFDKLRPYLPEVPEEIERLVAERTGIEWTAYKNREVIGSKMSGLANKEDKNRRTFGGGKSVKFDITAPATPEALKWQGWGTALKPAFEPIVVARKPFAKGDTVAANVLQWGTGGLNIDASRIASTGENFDNLQGRPIQKLATQRDGETHEEYKNRVLESPAQQEALEKLKTLGRWPANIILDPYTAELLNEQSDASRFFYVSKASKRDRNEGLEELDAVRHSDRNKTDGIGGDNSRNRTNEAEQNFHPTVKPTELMEYLIKLVTPEGGTVLDPFTGSGSTGKAALLNGFKFIGIELTEEYLPIIEGRLRFATDKKNKGLF